MKIYTWLLLLFCIIISGRIFLCADTVPENDTSGIRAVSMNALQMKLKQNTDSAELKKLTRVEGITRVMGCIIDTTNRDLVLFGSIDPDLPPLYIDDFAVALRNVQLKYAEYKGNTCIYAYPTCSIDPDPVVMKQLNQINLNTGTSQEKIDKEIEKWHETGKQPQRVWVEGIPDHCRFGKIMVDADYYMKRLVDGSVTLDIAGFISLADLNLNKLKSDILQNRPLSISSSLNRFWFFPGENMFSQSENMVMLTQCPVILLTEEEYVTDQNSIQGTGRENLMAREFTNRFTYYYEYIAAKESIFAELQGLFRWFALAKILNEQKLTGQVALDYLLDEYTVQNVIVEEELPGITNVKFFKHRIDYDGGYQLYQLYIPTCGGVGMELEIDDENIIPDKTGELPSLQNVVLDSRTNTDAVSWNIPAVTSHIEEADDYIPGDTVFTVDKADTGFYTLNHRKFALDQEAATQGRLVEILDDAAAKIGPDEKITVLLSNVETRAEAMCFVKALEFEAIKKMNQLKNKNLIERIIWYFTARKLNSLDFSRVQIGEPVKTSVKTDSGETREIVTIEITIPRIVESTGKKCDVHARSKGKITTSLMSNFKNIIAALFGKAALEKKNANWVADQIIKELKNEDTNIEEVTVEFSDLDIVYNPPSLYYYLANFCFLNRNLFSMLNFDGTG